MSASGFANSLSLLQTRQDFTTNLVNTLQDGASQLTIADKNEEGANLLALQTRQSLSTTALSLANQSSRLDRRLLMVIAAPPSLPSIITRVSLGLIHRA